MFYDGSAAGQEGGEIGREDASQNLREEILQGMERRQLTVMLVVVMMQGMMVEMYHMSQQMWMIVRRK